MAQAARVIITTKDQILIMRRNKHGDEYFTLVGGRVNDGENLEQALIREVKEETGLDISNPRLVFIEHHDPPYNDQYIYLAQAEGLGEVRVQDNSEEGMMNKIDLNTHQPEWVSFNTFRHLPFRTPQLQAAIIKGLADGWPEEAVTLT